MSSDRDDRVPAEPFVSWLFQFRNQQIFAAQDVPTKSELACSDNVVRAHFSSKAFATSCGLTVREYDNLRKGRSATLPLELVDRVLTNLDMNYKLNEWYPVDYRTRVG